MLDFLLQDVEEVVVACVSSRLAEEQIPQRSRPVDCQRQVCHLAVATKELPGRMQNCFEGLVGVKRNCLKREQQ